ncbi:hypothetical protein FSP39_022806 [Pinctada imbricata]|uniref:Uncharacterized protein n=1 Tax=Pinctada imbricata TaxID=66713 RepID=A0AA89BY25_PINIB|nr:hypothetical protein FSP39_022806 [Pinctada imbricata]
MNPEFPDPVDRAYEKCDCHLAATEMGIIKLVAILINPIYTQEDVDGWELSLKLAGGEIVPLDKMHRYTAEIEMPFVGSLDIRYRSYGDSTNLPTLIPTLPPGFWIQYKG